MALAIKRPGDILYVNRPAYCENMVFARDSNPDAWEDAWQFWGNPNPPVVPHTPVEGAHLIIGTRAQVPPGIELEVVEYDPSDVVRAEYFGGHPGVRKFTLTSFEVVDVLPPFTVGPLWDTTPYMIEWNWRAKIMLGSWHGEYGLPPATPTKIP